jgi:predicted GH43/DUF377 family glycosyl hydrolase
MTIFTDRFYLKFLCFISLTTGELFSLQDLDDLNQNYVLEMRQIRIAGYPDAFNPSIVRWQGRLLMSFRIRDPLTAETCQMGLVWLDDQFNPVSEAQILSIRNKSSLLPSKEQDPRFIIVRGDLYIVFNNVVGPVNLEMRRMLIAKVQNDQGQFYIENPEILLSFEGESSNRMQKNWVPFEWMGQLFLAYSISPHRIELPIIGENRCQTAAITLGDIVWEWGELRGGTPANIDNGQYLAFFHSYKNIATVQSEGKVMSHYFMGAYTFNPNPPFEITQISSEPLVGNKFYNGPMYKTWKPLRVVFPGGYVCDESHMWVVYGRQDHELWVVKLDKTAIYESLVPVHTAQK